MLIFEPPSICHEGHIQVTPTNDMKCCRCSDGTQTNKPTNKQRFWYHTREFQNIIISKHFWFGLTKYTTKHTHILSFLFEDYQNVHIKSGKFKQNISKTTNQQWNEKSAIPYLRSKKIIPGVEAALKKMNDCCTPSKRSCVFSLVTFFWFIFISSLFFVIACQCKMFITTKWFYRFFKKTMAHPFGLFKNTKLGTSSWWVAIATSSAPNVPTWPREPPEKPSYAVFSEFAWFCRFFVAQRWKKNRFLLNWKIDKVMVTNEMKPKFYCKS